MAYDFYIGKMLLPIAPSSLAIKISNQNKTITLINEGEINFLKKVGLTDISFEMEIPQVKYPFAVYRSGFQNAETFLDHFESLKTRQKPFQFLVSRCLPNGKLLFDTNIKVSLEDYTVKEEARNGFSLMVSIKLKQYKEYGTKTATIKVNPTTSKPVATIEKTRSAETAPFPKTYTVVSGDCLWNIAQKVYGNGGRYKEIASANSVSNPNLIYPGQVLTIT